MLQLEAVIKWPKPTINWRAHRLCFIAHSFHQAITSMLWFSSTLTDHICSYLDHYIFFHLTLMFVFPITSYFPLITVHFTSSPLFLLWPATAFFCSKFSLFLFYPSPRTFSIFVLVLLSQISTFVSATQFHVAASRHLQLILQEICW